jgi:pimeloyl-ACP methyl ester carboxylesterase
MQTQATGERRERISEQQSLSGQQAREWLIAAMPVIERRTELAGIPTAMLEGGEGPPVVLLHGPGEYAAKWFGVIPELAASHRVIAPDLPGHGASGGGPLDVERVLAWLGELIEGTCPVPPTLVGQIVGGAIAARFAARHGERIERLVLSDSLGLAPFRPTPEFWEALSGFLADPSEASHDRLWDRCTFDLDGLRTRLGDHWWALRAYNLDRANAPEVRAAMESLMAEFGMPEIPETELARIAAPTTLIWGRHDLATSLAVAEAASERYGWTLHVVEEAADDPPIEKPAAFLAALQGVLESS